MTEPTVPLDEQDGMTLEELATEHDRTMTAGSATVEGAEVRRPEDETWTAA